MVTKVKDRPYFFVIITRLLKDNLRCLVNKLPKLRTKRSIGTILDLCYHPYYPCLYAFWYSIPTFFSIFFYCFLYSFIYIFVPWLVNSDQSDCSIGGIYISCIPLVKTCRCITEIYTPISFIYTYIYKYFTRSLHTTFNM